MFQQCINYDIFLLKMKQVISLHPIKNLF